MAATIPNSPYRFYMRQLTDEAAQLQAPRSPSRAGPTCRTRRSRFDYMFDNIVIRGTVNQVVDRILALRETVGDFGTLLYCGKDWTDLGARPQARWS